MRLTCTPITVCKIYQEIGRIYHELSVTTLPSYQVWFITIREVFLFIFCTYGIKENNLTRKQNSVVSESLPFRVLKLKQLQVMLA